ncbi:uncharacterized protein LOC126673721 [Mercurialis annua]|uniref:uncharacterized protein LOC126673721 n=1 Tax=Mercurialis annua TaxID=3986 RepID=UPI00215EF80D|nr:uncharacterized protein LOC126673721 [Mercurialis annua]
MIRLSYKKLSQLRHYKPSLTTLTNAYLYPTQSSRFITNFSDSNSSRSLTLSYLQKSCGLSLESAITASKKLHLDSTENPDLVLKLLRNYGLNQIHIKHIISTRPLLLLADINNTLKSNLEVFKSLGISGTTLAKVTSKEPRVLDVDARAVAEFFRENGFSDEQIVTLTMKRPVLYLYHAHKTFKPKLDFFKSLGFSEFDIAHILSSEPYILERSLEKKIMPCVQVIRRVVGHNLNVMKAIKANYRILESNVEKVLEPNMLLMANHGVPDSLILKIFLLQPKSLLLKTEQLSEIIVEVKRMGFDPTNLLFVLAIRSMAVMNKALWELKLEAYRSFGLSNDEILTAFKMQPMCMTTSVKKISKVLNFFMNKLNFSPSKISKNPNLMLLSLEKRILPRCSVLNILMSKELIKEDVNLLRMFTMTEEMFLKKVLTKYQDMVPEIVEAHQGRIEFQGFSRDLKSN